MPLSEENRRASGPLVRQQKRGALRDPTSQADAYLVQNGATDADVPNRCMPCTQRRRGDDSHAVLEVPMLQAQIICDKKDLAEIRRELPLLS